MGASILKTPAVWISVLINAHHPTPRWQCARAQFANLLLFDLPLVLNPFDPHAQVCSYLHKALERNMLAPKAPVEKSEFSVV